MTHDELVLVACRWLRRRCHPPCQIVLGDFRCNTVDEFPDAIGWSTYGWSTLVECKASRADFLRDRTKACRRHADPLFDKRMGRMRYYMAEPGVLQPGDLPVGWGLLEVNHGRSVSVAVAARPFDDAQRPLGIKHELVLLLTAIRRHLEDGGTSRGRQRQAQGFMRIVTIALTHAGPVC